MSAVVSEAVNHQTNLFPQNRVVLAESGFGIFSVAYHTCQAGHDFLFRLSMTGFKPYRKKAELVEQGEGYKSYRLKWIPTAKERQTNPDIPAGVSIDVFIHELVLASGTTLASVPPRRLSFSGVWLSFQDHVLRANCETLRQWQIACTKGMVSASKRKLPIRKEPRDYPGIAHPRRQKTTK